MRSFRLFVVLTLFGFGAVQAQTYSKAYPHLSIKIKSSTYFYGPADSRQLWYADSQITDINRSESNYQAYYQSNLPPISTVNQFNEAKNRTEKYRYNASFDKMMLETIYEENEENQLLKVIELRYSTALDTVRKDTTLYEYQNGLLTSKITNRKTKTIYEYNDENKTELVETYSRTDINSEYVLTSYVDWVWNENNEISQTEYYFRCSAGVCTPNAIVKYKWDEDGRYIYDEWGYYEDGEYQIGYINFSEYDGSSQRLSRWLQFFGTGNSPQYHGQHDERIYTHHMAGDVLTSTTTIRTRYKTEDLQLNGPIDNSTVFISNEDTKYDGEGRVTELTAHDGKTIYCYSMDCFNLVALDVEVESINYSIYPNPTHGTVCFNGISPHQVKIYSMKGEEIYHSQLSDTCIQLDVQSGIYIASWSVNGTKTSRKIVVK